MAGFKDILGHEQIIGHLQNAIAMDKVSHAYIINGPDKSGKMMLAEAFAATLQCEAGGTGALRGVPFLQTGSRTQPAGYYLREA